MKRNKKIIVTIICFVVLFTSLPIVVGSSFSNVIIDPLQNDALSIIPEKNQSMDRFVPEIGKFKIDSSGDDGVLYVGNRTSLSQDPFENDLYHLNQEELDQLIEEGYSIGEIFEADDLGNHISADPRLLLERQSSEGKDLKQVTAEIERARTSEVITKLKKKHRSAGEFVSEAILTEEEQLELLVLYDRGKIKNMRETVLNLKTRGASTIKEAYSSQATSSVNAQDKSDGREFLDEQQQTIDEETMNKIKEIAQRTGQSVETLVNGYLLNIIPQEGDNGK